MEFLQFDTKEGAGARSEELWLERIGRDKVEGDVSCYLYGIEVADTDDGGSMMIVNDSGALLTDAEKSALTDEDSFLSWREEHQPTKALPDSTP